MRTAWVGGWTLAATCNRTRVVHGPPLRVEVLYDEVDAHAADGAAVAAGLERPCATEAARYVPGFAVDKGSVAVCREAHNTSVDVGAPFAAVGSCGLLGDRRVGESGWGGRKGQRSIVGSLGDADELDDGEVVRWLAVESLRDPPLDG